MSLFSNLHTASSGLNVASMSMSVIGDNIANVNTIGFKRGRATFSDSFPQPVSYTYTGSNHNRVLAYIPQRQATFLVRVLYSPWEYILIWRSTEMDSG